jgi:kynurenine formamidase
MSEPTLDAVRHARVVDLTHTLGPGFPLFPVYNPVEMAERFAVADDGFFVRAWSFDEHCGTHVDAPAHFDPEGATVERIGAPDLLLSAAVLDVRERVKADDDALIEPDDVLAWERRHGTLPDRCAVLALSGWGERAGDADAYLNADEGGTLHSPGFSPATTDYLKDERPQVRAIGLDTGSLDIGASADFPAHVSWLPSGRYGVENLANLERLPAAGAGVVGGGPPV